MQEALRTCASLAIKAVHPSSFMRKSVRVDCNSDMMKIFQGDKCAHDIDLLLDHKANALRPIFILAFGKASAPMANTFLNCLPKKYHSAVSKVLLSQPLSSKFSVDAELIVSLEGKITVIKGAPENIPDENSLRAAVSAQNLITSCNEQSERKPILFNLISGGGSALLSKPIDGLSLEFALYFDSKHPNTLILREKVSIIKHLSRNGASIQELNAVRIALSDVKGGKLIENLRNTEVVNLILSDIIGDPIELIASGPTVRPKKCSNAEEARQILRKFGTDFDETENVFERNGKTEASSSVENFIVCNNVTAVDSVETFLKQKYPSSVIYRLSCSYSADVETLINGLLNLAESFITAYKEGVSHCRNAFYSEEFDGQRNCVRSLSLPKSLKNFSQAIFIVAGEPTVSVASMNGKGGRNQHAALLTSHLLANREILRRHGFALMSLATDGQDGPTDSSGAIVDSNTVDLAKSLGLNLKEYLDNCDSYNFFEALSLHQSDSFCYSGHLKHGMTGTNVMDIVVVSFTLE